MEYIYSDEVGSWLVLMLARGYDEADCITSGKIPASSKYYKHNYKRPVEKKKMFAD